MRVTPPPAGTTERWAWDYVLTTDLPWKVSPPAVPLLGEATPPSRRLGVPGRPAALQVVARAPKLRTSAAALREPTARGRLLHTLWHHELQAAELMAWAYLAFPEAPPPFRRGLLAILADEVRHMALYAARLEAVGACLGAYPVRDWFWERVPSAPTPAHFVAIMGMGLEGGNLDHAPRFAAVLGEAGDHESAAVAARVADEEAPHVAFALHWFRAFTGGQDFDVWRAHLPSPLTPALLRGHVIAEEARTRAGFSAPFLARLAQATFSPPSGP